MSALGVSEFEEQLCKRIIDVCKAKKTIHNKEITISMQLATGEQLNSQYGKEPGANLKEKAIGLVDKTCQNKIEQKFEVEGRIKCEVTKHKRKSQVYKGDISCRRDFSDIVACQTPDFVKAGEGFTFSVDVFFSESESNKLLELKFPKFFSTLHRDTRWHYLQCDCNSSLESERPFTTPFVCCKGNNYISDVQEGAMFIDFIRLLKMWESENEAPNPELYFAAFFQKKDFAKPKNRGLFESRLAILFEHYFNTNFKFAVTVGKDTEGKNKEPLDLWPAMKPDSIEYFLQAGNGGFEKEEFFPDNSKFKCLHWEHDDPLVAFLVKLKPKPIVNSKAKRL